MKNSLIRALVLGSGLFIGFQSSAETWRATPRLSVSETYTDNADLNRGGGSSENDEDFITEIRPSVVILGDGNKLDVSLNYSVQTLFHTEDTDRDEVNHQLDGNLDSTLIDNFLFFNATARISQELVDFRDATSPDRIRGGRNTDDVYGYSVSPRITPRFGDILLADITYTYDYVESDGNNFNDSDGQSINAAITNGPTLANLFWNASYQLSRSDFDDGDRTETELASGNIGFRLNSQWSVNANGTYENNDFRGDRGNSSLEDNFYGGGLSYRPNERFSISLNYNERVDPRADEDQNFASGSIFWAPTPRTEMSASYGQRFFGDTYNASLSHSMRRASIQIAYNEGVSDFRQQFLSQQLIGALICPIGFVSFQDCRLFDQNNPPQLGEELVGITGFVPSIAEDTFISKQADVSWSIIGVKNVITLAASHQRREFVADDELERDLQGTLSWSYQIGARSNSSISLRYAEREFDSDEVLGAREEDSDYYITWNLSTRPTQKSTLSLEYSYSDRESDQSLRDFEENRVKLTYTQTF